MKGQFDKYYRKSPDGQYDIDGLSDDLQSVAVKFWRMKGIDGEVLVEKLDGFISNSSKWKTNKKIAVGNSYCNLIRKMEGGNGEGH